MVIALKNSVEIYAWAPKPYHKFMAFKVIGVCLRYSEKTFVADNMKAKNTDEQHDGDLFLFIWDSLCY